MSTSLPSTVLPADAPLSSAVLPADRPPFLPADRPDSTKCTYFSTQGVSASSMLSTKWRSDVCGRLNIGDVGRDVTVCGWIDRRREHSEHLSFIDLRDYSGVLQCVVEGERDLRSGYVLRVTGKVAQRPEGTYNPSLSTGEIELQNCDVEVISASQPLPFSVDERVDVDENLRLKHRYIDLRKPRMQHNLRVRAKVNAALRQAMDSQGFVEVETPMLVASTPEGARDFVVPSRKEPSSFYALPQSPQIFKQLCMVGGVDRYYQIARCLRDEDLRADRQFEFTQLDVEASFAADEDVFNFIEKAIAQATETVTGERVSNFGRMTWFEAMERFGTDKPDTRFGMELVELTHVFADTQARVFRASCVKGICLQEGAHSLTRSHIDDLVATCQKWGAKGLAWMKVVATPSSQDTSSSQDTHNSQNMTSSQDTHNTQRIKARLDAGVAKFLSCSESDQVISLLNAKPGDMVFLVADERAVVRHVLGLLRLNLRNAKLHNAKLRAKSCMDSKDGEASDRFSYLWITDFPLFEGVNADGSYVPSHHPFTMPHEDDLPMLMDADSPDTGLSSEDVVSSDAELSSDTEAFSAISSGKSDTHLINVRSQAYDLVLNGWELGSGSVRIHQGDIQRKIFQLLGIGDEEASSRFGFLLEAFRYGAPPHAGFALGIDRLVALLVGEENIREVIAFPKTQSGADPLSGAPSPIADKHLKELGLHITKSRGS